MNLDEFPEKEWVAEMASGFRMLKAIPSSVVRAYLAVIEDQSRDAEFLVRFATGRLSQDEREPFTRAVLEKMAYPEFMGYGELKAVVQLEKDERIAAAASDHIASAKAILESVTIPSAAEVRKCMFPHAESKLSSKPENMGGGEWRFPISHARHSSELNLDFGGMHSGFRWHLFQSDSTHRASESQCFSYERMMGIPDPHWDLVSHISLRADCELLLDLVETTLRTIENRENANQQVDGTR